MVEWLFNKTSVVDVPNWFLVMTITPMVYTGMRYAAIDMWRFMKWFDEGRYG